MPNLTVLYALENDFMANLVVDVTFLRKIFARLWASRTRRLRRMAY